MKSLHLCAAAFALCATAAAFATPAASTYTFQSPTASAHTAWSTAASGYDATGGTNYGTTYGYASATGTNDPLTISAWGSTGGVGGYNGTLQSAYIGRYALSSGLSDLGITSRPGTGNATELNASHAPNTGDNEHAIDNLGSYEAMLFSFANAVTLNSVSIGFPSSSSGLDSDATVLVYTGSGNPVANFASQSFADLVATGGWRIAGNLLDMTTTSANLLATSLSSKYWMVGAYMAIGGNSTTYLGSRDYFKIDGIAATPSLVTPQVVPEPGSLALVAIAAVGLVGLRRRKAA